MSDGRLPVCDAWMAANAVNAERLAMTRSASSTGIPSGDQLEKIYIVCPPAK